MDIKKTGTDFPASRFFRIFLSVMVCLLPALIVSNLLWPNPHIEGHYTHRAAAPLFLVAFLLPVFAGFTIIMTTILYWLDRRALRAGGNGAKQSALILLILSAGVLTGIVHVLLGAFFIFLLLYWLMTGRVAGRPGWSLRYFSHTKWDEKIYLIVMVALFGKTILWTASGLFYAAMPTQLGTPVFQVQFDHQMNSGLVRGLRKFPDVQSCLQRGATATHHGDLVRMDWDKITTNGEATVCMFRLLHDWGGVADAADWLEAQGFRVGESFSSKDPYVGRDGTLRVDGGWSIKKLGPRFPTTGVIRRILNAVPYGMGVNATYSSDGRELLYLRIGYSTL